VPALGWRDRQQEEKQMFDPELESFKTSIDLRAYAASRGYVLDRKDSWRGSAVMRHANGDKIIIKRDADNHYVYFSVRDETDHGTIIDFVQERLRLSLGSLRKELRPWVGRSSEMAPYPPLQPAAKDRMRVERAYAAMQDALGHPYLENERGIPPFVLQSDRFAGRVRIDARGNAVFPHFDRQGLCGFEIKNSGFTGFASGGTKGLWLSLEKADDNRLIFCESAIDALSYAVLFPDGRARYTSIGGQLSPQQCELMRAAAAGMPLNAKIVAATDEDAPGGKLADSIREAVGLTGRDDLCFVLHRPDGFKDWNDQLRNRPRRSLSSRPRKPSVV
jgi:hypothetical protein